MSDRFEITELEERIAPSAAAAACAALQALPNTTAIDAAAGHADTGLSTAATSAGC